MYACINVLTKLMYFHQILYLLGVNKYYDYDIFLRRCYPLTVSKNVHVLHIMNPARLQTIGQRNALYICYDGNYSPYRPASALDEDLLISETA